MTSGTFAQSEIISKQLGNQAIHLVASCSWMHIKHLAKNDTLPTQIIIVVLK